MPSVTHGRTRRVLQPLENATAVRLHVRGPFDAATADAVDRRLRSAFRSLPEPVPHARVRLTMITDPGVTLPAIGQVNLELRGRTVRAQLAAATPDGLAEPLADRLRSRVARAPREPGATPRRWQAQLNHLADVAPPTRERAVLRRKTCWLHRLTVDQAVTELEELDYDVHLFVERGTGRDAIVRRTRDAYRLVLAGPVPAEMPPPVSRRSPQALTVAAAKAQVEALGLPFLFFLDASTGRGAVLYHRYDGHFGVVTGHG